MIQNVTIEERVALLEIQVGDIEGDISVLMENDNFLFDEQVIQDERLFSLEQDTDDIISELDIIEDDLESESFDIIGFTFIKLSFSNILCRSAGYNTYSRFPSNLTVYTVLRLEDTTLALDFRVTALEENGGGDGNSSVAELEVRVDALEGTTADHETRISAAEVDINGHLLIFY